DINRELPPKPPQQRPRHMIVSLPAKERPLAVPLGEVAGTNPGQILGQRICGGAEERLPILILEDLTLLRQVGCLVADYMPTGAAKLAHRWLTSLASPNYGFQMAKTARSKDARQLTGAALLVSRGNLTHRQMLPTVRRRRFATKQCSHRPAAQYF